MSTPQKRIWAALLFVLSTMAAITTPAEAATWSTVPTLAPEGFSDSTLAGVSCTSSAFCVAVGTADDGGPESEMPTNIGAFSEVWDGSSWTPVPTADQSGSGGALASVSCVSESFCVAVGATHSDGRLALASGFYGQARALVELWNGSTWSIEPTPAGGLARSGLDGVSCVSASFCVAVGSHAPGRTAAIGAMVETWNGSGWKLQSMPFVAPHARGSGNWLSGVSCASPSACMAVGAYLLHVEDGRALVERWNGNRWSVERPPVAHLFGPSLSDVACPSRSACLAVGAYLNGNGTVAATPLVERRRSGHWRRVTAGLLKYGWLRDISCVGVNRCLAVGQFDRNKQPAPNQTAPLIMSWDGSRWSREPTPAVPVPTTEYGYWSNLNPGLFGISCPASGGCTAVGAQGPGSGASSLVQSTTESFAEPTPALPAPKITAAPAPTTISRAARFEFESSVSGATFECRLGGEGVGAALSHWSPCTSPRSYTHLAPGQKRFSVRAVLGAERSAATTREWTILVPGAPKPLVLPVVGRRASFHATCPLTERCRERVVVKAGGKELARGAYSIPAHADRQVEIGLTGTGERLLAHRSQVAATLVLENLRTHKRAEVAVLLERR